MRISMTKTAGHAHRIVATIAATTDGQGRARLQAPSRNRLYSITAIKGGFAQGKAPIRVGG